MSDPTRIIVYHNPAEAALWESGMVFPLMASAFIGFVFALMVGGLWSALTKYARTRNHHAGTVTVIAFIVGFGYSLHSFGVF